MERDVGSGDAFRQGPSGGRAREVKNAYESILPPIRTNPSGSVKGDGFPGGSKPLKRRYEAARFCEEAQERRGERERSSDHLRGDKALKGEAHERWGLKKASKVLGTDPRQEGSQTLKT